MRQYRIPPQGGLLFLVVFGLIIYALVSVPVNVMAESFHRLGLTPLQGAAVLVAMVVFRSVPLPLWKSRRLVTRPRRDDPAAFMEGMFRIMAMRLERTDEDMDLEDRNELVPQRFSVSVGGVLVPLAMSVYFLVRAGDPGGLLLWLGLSVAVSAAICAGFARPAPFAGIVLPVLAPPVAAFLAGWLAPLPGFGPETAWIAGSLGAFLGLVLHLLVPSMRDRISTPEVVLGGPGSFGGVFLVAFVAGLLATSA
jgi:uncharacterized membrane protein